MKLYNTLSRKVEKFEPINPPHVGMYTCGPTVYDYQHIGNFRTMTLSDLLSRALRFNGYEVKSVRNITDIDDKIIRNAALKNMPIREYSKEYTKIFFEDIEKLNILPVDVVTFATEYVEKMIVYIQALIKKGLAYVEPDGSVYFEISKFPNYGKLSGIDKTALKSGTRVLSDEYTKDNVQDFALWKSVGPEEREGYDSPWGRGRPGWHIECSVMSQENLGDTLDIHVGGRDLIFPHHENEIAQSEGKTGKKFSNFWVHGEFLNVDGGKMSKSLKNFYTLRDVEEKGFDPIVLRYFYLSAHYRTVLNFTWEGLEGAQNALNRAKNIVEGWSGPSMRSVVYGKDSNMGAGFVNTDLDIEEEMDERQKARYDNHLSRFKEAINNDLNTSVALSVFWEAIGDTLIPIYARRQLLERMDLVLGLNLSDFKKGEVETPLNIQKLVDERERLRGEKKFAEADKVREKIEKMGYTVKDSTKGSAVVKN